MAVLSQTDPYQMNVVGGRAGCGIQNIHEISEERKVEDSQGKDQQKQDMDGNNTIAVSTIEYNQRREMTTIEALIDGAGHESRTYESQQIRITNNMEVQRSSMNHESHHDQHDYQSTGYR